jgi:WD40 repeat protein
MSNARTAEAAAPRDTNEHRDECDGIPVIPIKLILPFVQDRTTWNAVCGASKEFHEAGMRMTPPWPATELMLWNSCVFSLKYSPCGSFLVGGACSPPYLVHICDRRRRQTCLRGHRSSIILLSFSNDGNYMAAVSAVCSDYHRSIRIWPTNPTTRLPTPTPRESIFHHDKLTLGATWMVAVCVMVDFSCDVKVHISLQSKCSELKGLDAIWKSNQ